MLFLLLKNVCLIWTDCWGNESVLESFPTNNRCAWIANRLQTGYKSIANWMQTDCKLIAKWLQMNRRLIENGFLMDSNYLLLWVYSSVLLLLLLAVFNSSLVRILKADLAKFDLKFRDWNGDYYSSESLSGILYHDFLVNQLGGRPVIDPR